MPYARISLMEGKDASYIQALSDSLHQALVEEFDVPLSDRFQIIHQLAPHELIFDRHYLAGPRSDDYILIAITAGRSRTRQKKQAFYRRLVDLLASSPGIRREDVMIVITTTQPDDWSFGDGLATMVAEETAQHPKGQ